MAAAVLAALAWAITRRKAPTVAVPASAAAPAVPPAPAPASVKYRRPAPPAAPADPSPRAPGLRDKGEALFGTGDPR